MEQAKEERTMKNLKPTNKCNAREVEMMVGKAMCAYANWQDALKRVWAVHDQGDDSVTVEHVHASAHRSEYEATVRCIDMLVEESIYEVQEHVTGRVKEEFGIG